MNWYDAPSGGNLVHTGSTYDMNAVGNQTFWVEDFGGEVIGSDVQTSTFSGMSRGYNFTAPCDFTISGVRVPDDASTDNQFVEIIKFNLGLLQLFILLLAMILLLFASYKC